VAFEGADNVGDGVGGERDVPAGVVAVHGFDQGEGGDLGQVIDEFTASGVAAGQPVGQRQILLDGPDAEPAALWMPGQQAVTQAQQLFGACLCIDRMATASGGDRVNGRGAPAGWIGGRRRRFEDDGGRGDDQGWFGEGGHGGQRPMGHAAGMPAGPGATAGAPGVAGR
jgi:hypothetical protein